MIFMPIASCNTMCTLLAARIAELLSSCGDDFCYMLDHRPGYVFIGNGDSAGLHTVTHDFNDRLPPSARATGWH